jgi:MFS family permease
MYDISHGPCHTEYSERQQAPPLLSPVLSNYLTHYRALHRNARLFLLSNITFNVGTSALLVSYTIFLIDVGFNTDFQSLLLALGLVGAGIGLIPALLIANRYSARRLLIWSNIIGGVAWALQLIWPNAAMLIITAFFIGSTASIYIILTPPLLAANSTAAERDHLFSLNASLGMLTGVVGTLLGGVLPDLLKNPVVLHSPIITLGHSLLVTGPALPYQLTLMISGVITFPGMLPLFLMDDTVIGKSTASESDSAPLQNIQMNIKAWLVQTRAWRRQWLTPEGVRHALSWPGTRFAGYQAVLGFGAGLFLTYINLYFVKHLHTTTSLYGAVASSYTIVLAVATLGGPLIAERLGKVRGPITSQLLSLLPFVIFVLTGNLPLVIALFLLRGVLMNVGQPILQSFIMGTLPPGERNLASTLQNIGFLAASALGGVISGIAIKNIGFTATFLVAAFCYLCGMLLMVPWFGKERTLLYAPPEQPQEPVGIGG